MAAAGSPTNSADSQRSRSTGLHAQTAGLALASVALFPPHTTWRSWSRRAARSDQPLDCGPSVARGCREPCSKHSPSASDGQTSQLQAFGALLCADPATRYLQRPRSTARPGIIDEDRQSYTCCGLGDAYSPERCVPPAAAAIPARAQPGAGRYYAPQSGPITGCVVVTQ